MPETTDPTKTAADAQSKDAKASTAPPRRLGETVLYYLPSGPKKGQVRSAVVTCVLEDGRLNLTVYLDGSADSTYVTPSGPVLLERAEGAAYAPAQRHEFGTWHLPE